MNQLRSRRNGSGTGILKRPIPLSDEGSLQQPHCNNRDDDDDDDDNHNDDNNSYTASSSDNYKISDENESVIDECVIPELDRDDDNNSKRNYCHRSLSPLGSSHGGSLPSSPPIYERSRSIQRNVSSTGSIRAAINELRLAIQQQAETYEYQNNNSAVASTTTGTTNTSTRLWWFWCRILWHVCHTIILLVLIGAVTTLFIQVQVLQTHIKTDESVIQKLQNQLATQQQSQQNLNERVVAEHSFTMYQLAGTFTLLTCLITMFHMTQHIGMWNEPVIQRKIVTILWMSPIYSITSWLSLVFPASAGYLSVVKDFYEAHVIYTFLSFLIAVLGRGDRNTAILVLSYHADHLKEPTRCFNSCYHPPPSISDQAKAAAVLLECQIWSMQFVLLRPFTSIVRFVLERRMETELIEDGGNDGETNPIMRYIYSPRFAIDMVTNISVCLAFHGLLKFYHAVHHDLKWCKPFSKFLTIKGIVFLTFWQGLLISILCNLDSNDNNNNIINSTLSNGNRTLLRLLTGSDEVVPDPRDDLVDSMNHTDNISSSIFFNSSTYPPVDSSGGDLLGNYTTHPNNITSSIYTNGTAHSNFHTTDPDGDDDGFSFSMKNATIEAKQIQNFLICLEMLFFTIAHWCVFPAEEWKPDYRPPTTYAKPGLGLKDFASDISYIVSSSTSARAYSKKQRQKQKQQDERMSTVVDEDDGGTNTGSNYYVTCTDISRRTDPTYESSDDDNNNNMNEPSFHDDDDDNVETPGVSHTAHTPVKRVRRTWGRRGRTRYENIEQDQQQDDQQVYNNHIELTSSSSSLGLNAVFEHAHHPEKDFVNANYDHDLNNDDDQVAIVIPPLPDDDNKATNPHSSLYKQVLPPIS